MGRPATNLKGNVFGRWEVLYRDISSKKNDAFWICRCQCENKTIKSISAARLKTGTSTSCGCYRSEFSSESKTIHGESKTKFYRVWVRMRRRCLNPKSQDYPNYGGRGICVCDSWLDYFNFKHDMFISYKIHTKNNKSTTIERVDVNGNYTPENCIWATQEEQNKNKRCMKYFKAIRLSDEYEEICNNQREFARKYNLNQSHLNFCVNGKVKTCKGWKLILLGES